MATLTSANSSFSLSCPSVFTTSQTIQGYSADDAFDTGEVKPSEVLMGVDGHLSGGYVPYPTVLTFMLQATSPSVLTMDQLLAAMDSAQETYELSATIVVPSVYKIYTFSHGFLTGQKKTPAAKKILQPQRYEITFRSCQPQPYSA